MSWGRRNLCQFLRPHDINLHFPPFGGLTGIEIGSTFVPLNNRHHDKINN